MQNLSTQLIPSQVTEITMNTRPLEERITLKALTSEDLEAFWKWAGDPEVAKTMTWEAYTSSLAAEKFLKEVAEGHLWFKAICLDGFPVGSITLTRGQASFSCKAELGFVLAKEHWGKGIATEAVKKALKIGFKDLNIQRIEALVDPDNIASQRVLIKAGMHCEGLLKNYILFKGSLRDRYIYSFIV